MAVCLIYKLFIPSFSFILSNLGNWSFKNSWWQCENQVRIHKADQSLKDQSSR